MVSSIQNNQSQYGGISKVGQTENGRAIYQITEPSGNVAGKVSVPQNQCDKFEKSFNTILKSAPKMEDFAKNMTPEKYQKRKKTANWTLALTSIAGCLIPAIVAKKGQVWKTILGTLGGLSVGALAKIKLTTPPGTMKMALASQKLQKIDVQPYEN